MNLPQVFFSAVDVNIVLLYQKQAFYASFSISGAPATKRSEMALLIACCFVS